MTNLSTIRNAAIEDAGAGGLTVYASVDNLPTTGLTSGDQAYVTDTSRLYISNGSGWYNVALVNATPSLTISPSGAIELNTDGSTTTITLTATDSDYPDAALTFSVDSDGNFGGLASLSQDSSVFTITPLSEDSATTTSSTLTFKASDGISFGSGDRTLTLEFKVANSNYTTLLAKADTAGTDNQVDASSNSYTITENGNVTSTAFSPYHPGGYSAYFGGSDYISIADGAYKTLGSDPWTYECWVYPTSVAAGIKYILGDHASSGSGATTSANIWLNGANFGIFCRTSAGNNINLNESTTRSVNQWYHLALVFDQTNVILYVDGTAVITQAHSSGFNDGSGSFSVGRSGDYAGAYFSGYVRDVRLVKGTAVYTSSFTPPTESLTAISGTEILLCHQPYIADGSTNNNTVTIAGNTSTKRFGPYDYQRYKKTDHGGSIYSDGNGDYLNVAGSNLYSVGSVSGEPFTIEFWFNYSAVGSNGNGLVTKGTAGSTGAGDILTIDLIPGTRYIGCTLDGSYSGYEIQSSTALKENVWYHIALVKNSSNLYTLYINGKADGTYSATGTISASSNFYIGTNYYSPTDANRSPQGIYSDVRVVSDAVYTTNFAPPTAPLTAITNTELLTCTNKNDIWDVGTGRVLTKVGNTTASNTKRKFTTSSAIYFDGTGDEIQTLTNNFFSYGTGDFTWEFWMNPSSQGTYDYILTQNTHTSANGLGLYLQGGVLKLYHNSGAALTGSTTISNGTWYHVALAREGTNLRLFLDGSLETSTTNSANILTGSTYGIVIGRWTEIGDGQYYDGYLQDVRVTRGLARYTTNFTPPTAEFAG